MDFDQYIQLIQDPSARERSYADMVRSYYDFATDVYREMWGDCFHLTWFNGEQSLEEAQFEQERQLAVAGGFRKGMHILDVGCGVGGPAMAVASYSGARVTGVNLSSRQVEIARNKFSNPVVQCMVDFVVGDAMDLPFPDDSFDGAMSIEAICHTPDKKRVYSEVARVLRPGAPFAGYDWFTRDGISPSDYAEYIEPICQSLALPNLISMEDLEKSLAACGFATTARSQYTDHGDLEPLWRAFDDIAERMSTVPEVSILLTSLECLRRGTESGAFVLGCWTARKANGRATA